MKRGSTLFLKAVILHTVVLTLAGMVIFPQTEGRALNLSLIDIYKDPFIIYIYIASIPFFIGLYQAFMLLNLIDADKAFSKDSESKLKNIQLACFSLIGFIAFALLYIRLFVKGEDSTGPSALGILVIFAFGAIATLASIFQKRLQKEAGIK